MSSYCKKTRSEDIQSVEERSEENTPGKCRLQHLAEGSFQRIKRKAKSDSCGNQILEPETFPGVFVFSFLSLSPLALDFFSFSNLIWKRRDEHSSGEKKEEEKTAPRGFFYFIFFSFDQLLFSPLNQILERDREEPRFERGWPVKIEEEVGKKKKMKEKKKTAGAGAPEPRAVSFPSCLRQLTLYLTFGC